MSTIVDNILNSNVAVTVCDGQVVEGDRVVGSHVLPSIFVDPGDTATDEEYTPRVPSITLERFHTATARPPSLTRA